MLNATRLWHWGLHHTFVKDLLSHFEKYSDIPNLKDSLNPYYLERLGNIMEHCRIVMWIENLIRKVSYFQPFDNQQLFRNAYIWIKCIVLLSTNNICMVFWWKSSKGKWTKPKVVKREIKVRHVPKLFENGLESHFSETKRTNTLICWYRLKRREQVMILHRRSDECVTLKSNWAIESPPPWCRTEFNLLTERIRAGSIGQE